MSKADIMDANPLRKLDDVLTVLRDSKDKVNIAHIQVEFSKIPHNRRDHQDNTDEHINEVLDKLIDDKYSIRHQHDEYPSRDWYSITFLGRFFLAEGGYQKRALFEDIAQRQALRLTQMAAYGSMGATVFGFAYLFWLVYAFWLEHCHRLYW